MGTPDRGVALPAAINNRPELALLLTIARVDLDPSRQTAMQDLLAGPLDWECLLSMAVQHGLEPLLFLHLHRIAPQFAPQEFMQALRADCKTIAARNLILASRLKSVSAHLRSRKIEHIAYKGPLLAETYFGNCALRVSYDLDILVQPSQFEAARDALGEIGFSDKNGLSAGQQAMSFRFGFEHSFTAPGGVDLDLHWRVVQKFKSSSLDMEGVWQRATSAHAWGCEMPTLCPEDLLVALCLHAGHHGWMQLSHLCDIAQLFQVHLQLDWDIVRRHLGDSNTTRIVYVSLHLLEKYWQANIPGDLKAAILADPNVARLARRIQSEIWPSSRPALTTSSLRWLWDRSSGVDLADRLRLLTGTFFCPAIEDVEMFRLPRILATLYPGLRALRLAFKYSLS